MAEPVLVTHRFGGDPGQEQIHQPVRDQGIKDHDAGKGVEESDTTPRLVRRYPISPAPRSDGWFGASAPFGRGSASLLGHELDCVEIADAAGLVGIILGWWLGIGQMRHEELRIHVL